MNKSKGVVGIIILLTGVMLFGCGDKNNKSSEEAKSEIFSTKEQGVAETKITCGILSSNSSKVNGLLS